MKTYEGEMENMKLESLDAVYIRNFAKQQKRNKK